MRFAFLIISVLICGSLSAQDIIVRITGDTLHVKVDSQNDTFVYYVSHDSKRGELEVISRKEVARILYNYEKPNKNFDRKISRKGRDYQILQFYGQYAVYYLPDDNIPDEDSDFEQYYKDLQFGTGYKVGVNYFLNRQFGLGLTYALSKFSNSILVTDTASGAYGKLSDDIRLNYFGLSAEMRFEFGESESDILLSLGAGMNFYRNDAELIYGYNVKAQGLGFHGTLALNLSLGGGLYIPVTLGYMGNTVGNISLDMSPNMPDDYRESLEYGLDQSKKIDVGRFFVGVGLSLAF